MIYLHDMLICLDRPYNYMIGIVYSYEVMKRTAIFFVLALLVLMPCTAIASTSQVSAKEGTCNVTIKQFIVHPATGIAPAKIGFTTYMAGHVTRVRYQALNKSGKVVASCSSYCAHCTKKDICTCSLIIKQPGTYNVKVTAYSTGNCCVEQTKKSAVTVTTAKLVQALNPQFPKRKLPSKTHLQELQNGPGTSVTVPNQL